MQHQRRSMSPHHHAVSSQLHVLAGVVMSALALVSEHAIRFIWTRRVLGMRAMYLMSQGHTTYSLCTH